MGDNLLALVVFVVPNALGGNSGARPNVGFRPGNPVKPHGIRIDPAVSLPSAPATSPAATAAADPPLDPPAIRSGCGTHQSSSSVMPGSPLAMARR